MERCSDFSMNILICEDDIYQREILADMFRNHEFVNSIEMVTNGEELIETVLSNPEISALFIDYMLDKRMTGLDAYMILQQRGHALPAVLITAYKLDANRAYDLGILDVVEKPYTPYRIEQAFQKIHGHLSYSHFIQNGGLYVPIHNQEISMLMPSDILFFEAVSGIVKVHTLNGILETKIPLKLYEKYLQHTSFFYSHRAFLVNVKKIHYIEGNKIYFRDTDHVAQVTDEKQFDVQSMWRKFCVI